MKKFNGLAEFVAAEGAELGPTEWLEITQERVNLFADATDDHQWFTLIQHGPPADRSAEPSRTGC